MGFPRSGGSPEVAGGSRGVPGGFPEGFLGRFRLQRVPPCKTCFCRWVVAHSLSCAASSVALAAGLGRGSDGAALAGFDGLMGRAGVTNERALRALRAEILQHGAAHVGEVLTEDWATFEAWELLGLFEQRRLLAAL